MKNLLPGGCSYAVLFAAHLFLFSSGELSAQDAALVFDHASGFYDSAFLLNISTPLQGATVYVTTNGSAPTPVTGFRCNGAVPITTTTIIRAAAFINERALTEAARTYLFIPAILTQTGAQLPKFLGTDKDRLIPAHYRMAGAADNAATRTLSEAFRAIPSLSVITDPENLFSADTGIYFHPLERGVEWERPVNAEMFDGRGQSIFQISCGLRIHGGMSRRPEESPKHSFRLAFKRRYGLPKLRVPLFGPSGAQEFNDLVLRAGSNDSWLDSNGTHRRHAAYIRDEWMRRSMHAMGYPSARGTFVHLYLNGLYWGIYNLSERAGPSLFAQNDNSNYDFKKADELESGDLVVWDKMLSLVNAGLGDKVSYQAIHQYLDVPAFADYMILNLYAGNSDWDRSANWSAIRPRIPGGKFQFLVWDAERILGDPQVNTIEFDDDDSPMRIFRKLSENDAFRALFAKRASRLLFDKGPLSPEASAGRFRALANPVAKAMRAEAARWGNYRKDVHQYKSGPFEIYTTDEHWQPEADRVLTDFFPQRRAILLNQFREHGLFPLAAPVPSDN